jgi:hypothetical protein
VNRNPQGTQDFIIVAAAMQRHYFRLKTVFAAIPDQLADSLLGAAAAQVVYDMQDPILCGTAVQAGSSLLAALP